MTRTGILSNVDLSNLRLVVNFVSEKHLTVTAGEEKQAGDESGQAPAWREPGQISMLVEETQAMENARRVIEQRGHARYARVNPRERHDFEAQNELSEQIQKETKTHPILGQTQRFDGIDPNLNPEPAVNTEARREYDNQRREQEKEKQLRLGNMPKMGQRPKPNPF